MTETPSVNGDRSFARRKIRLCQSLCLKKEGANSPSVTAEKT